MSAHSCYKETGHLSTLSYSAVSCRLTVTLLTPESRGSGLVILLATALFDGTRLFTYSRGKWETHVGLGEM